MVEVAYIRGDEEGILERSQDPSIQQAHPEHERPRRSELPNHVYVRIWMHSVLEKNGIREEAYDHSLAEFVQSSDHGLGEPQWFRLLVDLIFRRTPEDYLRVERVMRRYGFQEPEIPWGPDAYDPTTQRLIDNCDIYMPEQAHLHGDRFPLYCLGAAQDQPLLVPGCAEASSRAPPHAICRECFDDHVSAGTPLYRCPQCRSPWSDPVDALSLEQLSVQEKQFHYGIVAQ